MRKRELELEWENVILKEALILSGENLETLLNEFHELMELMEKGAGMEYGWDRIKELKMKASGLVDSNRMIVKTLNEES